MRKSSILIRYERCPACAAKGRDKRGSNLGVYSDGHSFCYSCKLYIDGDKLARLKPQVQEEEIKHSVVLPYDSDIYFPSYAVDWIQTYGLTKNDLLNQNVVWSASKDRLIFPFYGGSSLLAWQGRYFGDESRPKWYSQGDMKNIFHILGSRKESLDNALYLVEDIVSAIKLSKYVAVMPVFGSVVGMERWNRIKFLPFNKIIVWLDPDKREQSIKEARMGQSIGLNVGVQFAICDPKEVSSEDLYEMVM